MKFQNFTDLKQLYYQTGVDNKQTVFIFTDVQAIEESFMEDINNILSSGEVPNLFKVSMLSILLFSTFLNMFSLTMLLVYLCDPKLFENI